MSELAELGLLATPADPEPRISNFDDFAAMKTLAAAVKEAMRMLPVSLYYVHVMALVCAS